MTEQITHEHAEYAASSAALTAFADQCAALATTATGLSTSTTDALSTYVTQYSPGEVYQTAVKGQASTAKEWGDGMAALARHARSLSKQITKVSTVDQERETDDAAKAKDIDTDVDPTLRTA
ncbi:hypothetical protein [Mycolicibacterium fallax]|uniref:Uncharacterized protein n=1 Tax=Mycolicibacterium fallax TaxID=1793 RepID=A0A1X1R7R6_MYCFA|nr:hypothetical protein [Mycolicibacterium fallax]ORV00964.1 hypothetical protein AWC04_14930 [Mycolicibacterium fallax]BBZ00518.1 hypothetical protein MFAL_39840 [Mycolicibacterium fallax]